MMQFNREQQEAIDARGHSIVSAGAGAGKTAVLVERYISLLKTDNLAVENILCLTFTRKAAGEMYRRIYHRLNQEGSPMLQREFLRFDRARITTIDSFCSRIIKPYVSEYGYPVNFHIDEGNFLRELESFTLNYLASSRRSRIITRLLEQFSYEKIVRELFIRLGSTFLSLTQVGGTHGAGGGDSAGKDGTGKDGTIGQAEIFFDLLNDLARRELITLQRAIPEILHVNAQEQKNAQNKEHHREAMNTCSRCLTELDGMSTIDENMEAETIMQKFRNKNGREPSNTLFDRWALQEISWEMESIERKKREGKIDNTIAVALIEVLQPAVAALYFLAGSRSSRKPWKHWKELCTKIRTILIPALLIFTEQEFYTEFYELADDYLCRVREFKRKRGVFYYRDLLELSIRILLDHPALADYYRKEIQYIMIDEFQDNNVLQKNLLFLLSAPQGYSAPEIPNFSQLRSKGLFLVGDQKQSIYRFRGADVSVFRKLGREFHTESNILSLNTNYRSSRDLIDFFNHFFPRIMGGREDFEADYSPLETGRSTSIASHIELILHRERKKTDLTEHDTPLLSRQEMEAYSIAKRIYEICNDDTLLKQEGDAVTPVSYDDIAILFRSGTIQYLIEKMLRRFDIPFSSDSIRSLFLDAPAFDAHALLKLCIFPEDSFSLAAVLRSPFCRLGDDTIAALLFQLADGRLSSGEKIPLHDQSAHADQSAQSGSENAMRGIMSSEDVSAYNALLDFLDDIRSLIGHCSHSELLAEMWKRSAYLNYVDLSPRRRTWLEHYDYLLEFFDLHADVPLVELLEIMEANLGKFGKIEDISIVQEKKRGVSIMSVHKAKGLEFPVVFLVNTNGKERNSTEASASWVSGKNGELILYGGLGRATSAKYLKDDPGMIRSYRNPLVKQYENDECERENAETRRILYVAMTRAEQHLFISASGIKNSRKERSQTEPAREWNENFFDLIQAGMNLNPEEIVQQGPLYRSEQRTEAGSIFLTLPEPVGRNDLQPIHSAPEAGDFSGPARQLPLPPMPRTHFSVNEMQKFQLSKDHTANGEDHHTEAQNTIGGTDGDRQGGDSLRDGDRQDGDSEEAAEFGTLLHYLLEKAFAHVRKTGEMYIPPASLLSHTSLPSRIRNDHALYEQACDIVHSLTRTELFRNIEDADEAYFELPFTLCLEEFSIHGKIDLFLVTGERTMLIDYKSGRSVKPEDYRMQLDIYRLALEMMGWPEPEAIIYDLRQNEPHRLQRRFTKREITDIARELSKELLTT